MKRSLKEKIFYYSQSGLYRKKIESLRECEEKVIWLLAKYSHLRDCDKCLLFNYWAFVDGLDVLAGTTINTFSLNRELVHKLTPAETITRIRRYIQNDLGLFLPTDPDVIKAREISELDVHDWANRIKEMEIEVIK